MIDSDRDYAFKSPLRGTNGRNSIKKPNYTLNGSAPRQHRTSNY